MFIDRSKYYATNGQDDISGWAQNDSQQELFDYYVAQDGIGPIKPTIQNTQRLSSQETQRVQGTSVRVGSSGPNFLTRPMFVKTKLKHQQPQTDSEFLAKQKVVSDLHKLVQYLNEDGVKQQKQKNFLKIRRSDYPQYRVQSNCNQDKNPSAPDIVQRQPIPKSTIQIDAQNLNNINAPLQSINRRVSVQKQYNSLFLYQPISSNSKRNEFNSQDKREVPLQSKKIASLIFKKETAVLQEPKLHNTVQLNQFMLTNSSQKYSKEMNEFIKVEMNCLSEFNERKKILLSREKNRKRKFNLH